MKISIKKFDGTVQGFYNVRLATVFPHADGAAPREIVIHSKDIEVEMSNVPLYAVESIIITEE